MLPIVAWQRTGFGVTSNEWSREVTRIERERSGGVDINEVEDMIFLGEHSHVGEYLQRLGWDISTQTVESRFVANDKQFRRDDSLSGLLDAHYTFAALA